MACGGHATGEGDAKQCAAELFTSFDELHATLAVLTHTMRGVADDGGDGSDGGELKGGFKWREEG